MFGLFVAGFAVAAKCYYLLFSIPVYRTLLRDLPPHRAMLLTMVFHGGLCYVMTPPRRNDD